MNRIIFPLSILAFLALTAALPLATYQINTEGAKVSFTIKNLGMEVNGTLDNPEGTVVFDPNDLPGSSVRASIKVATINTGIDARDEELIAEEYFDATQHPRISFQSTRISKSGAGFQATGKLTIKGHSETVNIPFTVENNVFKGSFQIDRLDYGVGESGWILSDEVKVKFSLPVNE